MRLASRKSVGWSMKPVSFSALQAHGEPGNAWIAVNGTVYDISDFKHPGGAAILRPYLGRDGSVAFAAHHNTDVLSLVAKKVVGVMDEADAAWQRERKAALETGGPAALDQRRASLPPLAHVLNTRDLEAAAGAIRAYTLVSRARSLTRCVRASEKAMEPAGWAYYASAADDEITLRENQAAFARIWLRPRVMVNVSKINVQSESPLCHMQVPA